MDVIPICVCRRCASVGRICHRQAMTGSVVSVVLGRDRSAAVALLLLDQLIADALVGEGCCLG